MRVLIISEPIEWNQREGTTRYETRYDVELDVVNINDAEGFQASVFDYDITIVQLELKSSEAISQGEL